MWTCYNKNDMKEKKNLIIIGIIIIILLGGGFYVLSSNKTKQQTTTPQTQEDVIPTLTPEQVGLTMIASADNKKVKFTLDNVSDIKHIEYEITYDADIPPYVGGEDGGGDGTGRVTRGTSGEADIAVGESMYESKFHDLGTCSSGTCKYDIGVNEVKLLLKITKKDGKVYQVEDTLKI